MVKTLTVSKNDIERKWYLIDAEDVRLGKLATNAANLLMGKGKKTFVRNLEIGDSVVVINAEKISVSADKLNTKKYYRHTGFPGGIKEETLGHLLDRKPENAIMMAVRGMLPKNKMGDKLITNLHVFKGADHKHEAQNPVKFQIK